MNEVASKDIVPFGHGNEPWNDSDNRTPVEGCRLCVSKLREEAEIMYDKCGRYSKVFRWLEDKGVDISYHTVRKHLSFHYTSRNNNSLIREYAGEVQKWIKIQNDDATSIKRTMAMLEREMHTLAAMNEELDLCDRRKNTETVQKLAIALLHHRKLLTDIQGSREPVTIVLNQLQIIMEEEIKKTKVAETKRVMVNVLDRLQDSCGDILVEVEE